MVSKKSDAVDAGAVQEVERIRDIIFGADMRRYDQRFTDLQGDFERLRQALDTLTEHQSEGERRFEEKVQTLRQTHRQAEDELRNELRQSRQDLDDAKVDRQALAELFEQLAAQLRGGSGLGEMIEALREDGSGG